MVQGQPPPPLPPPFRIANMYGDHMVLQQEPAQANIWGFVSKCDSKISATFNKKTLSAVTFNGKDMLYTKVIVVPVIKKISQ